MTFLSLLAILLVGCGESAEEKATGENKEAYETTVQKGVDELQLDHFEKAIAYFERALEEEEESEEAATLLEQTEAYMEARELFEEEQYEAALEKAEAVQGVADGSTYLSQQANQLHTEIGTILAEEKEAEQQAKTEEERLEEFQGVFALFSGTPYESAIEFTFMLNGETTMEGFRQSDYVMSEVTAQSFEGDTLIMDIHTPAQPGYGESTHQLAMNLGYDEKGDQYIVFGTEEKLYPITVDDLLESGFNVPSVYEPFFDELRAYDQKVPRTISWSNTEALEDYSAKEIEYARVWLNTIGHVEVDELNVQYEREGTPINTYDDESAVYPEDVTIITGRYTADGMIVYSGNGDGTINIYDVPSHWHAPPEDWPAIYEDILDTSTLYLEPMNDSEVVQLIEKMTIHE